MAPPTTSARGQAKYTSNVNAKKPTKWSDLPTEPGAELQFGGAKGGKHDQQAQDRHAAKL